MTDPSFGPSTTAEGGVATLVNLPARVDLPVSGVLEGICGQDDLSDLNLLVVVCDGTPDDWIGTVAQWNGRTANLGIVDVDDANRSTATRSTPDGSPGPVGHTDDRPELVTPLADPTDFEALGVAVARYLDDWTDSQARTVVLVDSVSWLLDAVDRTEAVQFLGALRRRIVSTDATGFFVARPDLHSPETMSMLRSLCDDVVEYVGTESDITADLLEDPLMDDLDGRRRLILDQLVHERELTVSELASRTAATGVSEDPERVEVGLVHTHLPKLANHGLISYDPGSGTVELAVPVERIRPYLRLARERNGH